MTSPIDKADPSVTFEYSFGKFVPKIGKEPAHFSMTFTSHIGGVQTYDLIESSVTGLLNHMGANGWELVTVNQLDRRSMPWFWFKRTIEHRPA